MIAFREELPLVKFAGGELACFERGWLVRSLVAAAQKAGYPQWWLAEHVAESVASYLQLRFEHPIVALPRLAKAVQAVLQVIGYAEVATHFSPGPPPVKISLLHLARAAGSGYELAFFALLGSALQPALKMPTSYCELFGLEGCVRKLRAKKIWSRDCETLRSEIIAFVRAQLEGLPRDHEITCSLT